MGQGHIAHEAFRGLPLDFASTLSRFSFEMTVRYGTWSIFYKLLSHHSGLAILTSLTEVLCAYAMLYFKTWPRVCADDRGGISELGSTLPARGPQEPPAKKRFYLIRVYPSLYEGQ